MTCAIGRFAFDRRTLAGLIGAAEVELGSSFFQSRATKAHKIGERMCKQLPGSGNDCCTFAVVAFNANIMFLTCKSSTSILQLGRQAKKDCGESPSGVSQWSSCSEIGGREGERGAQYDKAHF